MLHESDTQLSFDLYGRYTVCGSGDRQKENDRPVHRAELDLYPIHILYLWKESFHPVYVPRVFKARLDRNLRQAFCAKIRTDKESIVTIPVAADQSVPFLLSKFDERQQRSAGIERIAVIDVVIAALKVRPIRDRERLIGADDVLILDNDNSWLDAVDSLPHPVIDAVYVDR